MTLRRIALFLTMMLVAPLAIVATAPSANALGQRTQKWDNGYFEASITVNWKSKHVFVMWGWIEDTACDSRGVYLPRIYQQHKEPGGGYGLGTHWNILAEDDDGCDNGRVQIRKTSFTAGKKKVPMLRVPIYSEDDEEGSTGRVTYSNVWNNPYIDG